MRQMSVSKEQAKFEETCPDWKPRKIDSNDHIELTITKEMMEDFDLYFCLWLSSHDVANFFEDSEDKIQALTERIDEFLWEDGSVRFVVSYRDLFIVRPSNMTLFLVAEGPYEQLCNSS